MREIKFRGIDELNNIWRFGSLIYIKKGDSYSRAIEEQFNNGLFPAFVKPETVGQYIGIKDKNGKEIWEGDIVIEAHSYEEDKEDAIGVIKYGYGSFYINNNLDSEIIDWGDVEVIGNIHENPEFISETKPPLSPILSGDLDEVVEINKIKEEGFLSVEESNSILEDS